MFCGSGRGANQRVRHDPASVPRRGSALNVHSPILPGFPGTVRAFPLRPNRQGGCMRKLLLGLASIAAVAAVTPASAQGFYFGAPGVSVGVGAPAYRERYYDYGPRYRAHRYYGDDAYAYAPRGC